MLMTTLQVALGGAIGAALRFLSGMGIAKLVGSGFPFAILSVNVIGSFLMGFLVVATAKTGQAHLNPFLLTGILGGFTTFSAFSLDAVTLFERGAIGQSALYVLASVSLSIAGLVVGLALAREIFA